MFVFSESWSFAKDVLLQKIDCVFVLAIRGLLHMIKNFACGVILRFNHFYGIFFLEKFFLKKKIMVLSKTYVRFRNRIFKRFEWVDDQIIFFSLCVLGKRFQFAIMEIVLKTFPLWALTFFLL
jgi:hypothetical protein